MKKITKEKRDQLILVCMLIAGVLVGLYFGLIRFQQQGLDELADQRSAVEGKLAQVQQAIKSAQQIETELAASQKLLVAEENNMATGDKYSWMINFVTKFKSRYHVDIPQFDRTTDPADVKLLPKFPYKQVGMGVSGGGFYHDIGKFISDFENQYTSSYITDFEISPSANQSGEEHEKLSFRMQIMTLVKSDTP